MKTTTSPATIVTLAATLLLACGPAQSGGGGGGTSGGSDPMSVADNQNAPPPQPVEATIPSLVLWCSRPGGPACSTASSTLGVEPVAGTDVPMELFGSARDLPNDCDDAEVTQVRDRLSGPLQITGAWVDQGGQLRSAQELGDLYTGSGCTNASQAGVPAVKIHIVDLAGSARTVVRVFEAGEF